MLTPDQTDRLEKMILSECTDEDTKEAVREVFFCARRSPVLPVAPQPPESGEGREGEVSVIWALVNEYGAVTNPTPVEPPPGNSWEGNKQWRYQKFVAAHPPAVEEVAPAPALDLEAIAPNLVELARDVDHEASDCPEDDTCDCKNIADLNRELNGLAAAFMRGNSAEIANGMLTMMFSELAAELGAKAGDFEAIKSEVRRLRTPSQGVPAPQAATVTIPRWVADMAVAAINFLENPTETMRKAREVMGAALSRSREAGLTDSQLRIFDMAGWPTGKYVQLDPEGHYLGAWAPDVFEVVMKAPQLTGEGDDAMANPLEIMVKAVLWTFGYGRSAEWATEIANKLMKEVRSSGFDITPTNPPQAPAVKAKGAAPLVPRVCPRCKTDKIISRYCHFCDWDTTMSLIHAPTNPQGAVKGAQGEVREALEALKAACDDADQNGDEVVITSLIRPAMDAAFGLLEAAPSASPSRLTNGGRGLVVRNGEDPGVIAAGQSASPEGAGPTTPFWYCEESACMARLPVGTRFCAMHVEAPQESAGASPEARIQELEEANERMALGLRTWCETFQSLSPRDAKARIDAKIKAPEVGKEGEPSKTRDASRQGGLK